MHYFVKEKFDIVGLVACYKVVDGTVVVEYGAVVEIEQVNFPNNVSFVDFLSSIKIFLSKCLIYSVALVKTIALLTLAAGDNPSKSLMVVLASPAAILKAGTESLKAVIFVLMFVLYFFSITL